MAVTLRRLVNVLITTETYGPTGSTALVSVDVLNDIKTFLEIPVNTDGVREKIRDLVSAVIAERDAQVYGLISTVGAERNASVEQLGTTRALRERTENELIEMYQEND